MNEEYTFEQLYKFERYEKVRQSGWFNMFDPRARQATGLNREDYLFVLSNYESLAKAAKEDAAR